MMSAEEYEFRRMAARLSGEHADDDGIGVTRFHRDALDCTNYGDFGNRLDEAPQPKRNTVRLSDAASVSALADSVESQLDTDEQPWERDRLDVVMLRLDATAPSVGQQLPIRQARQYLITALRQRARYLLL